jgi:hypothetical protein
MENVVGGAGRHRDVLDDLRVRLVQGTSDAPRQLGLDVLPVMVVGSLSISGKTWPLDRNQSRSCPEQNSIMLSTAPAC